MKKPKIRFKGYTDAWEQRKFNDVFVFMQNNSLSRAELSPDEGDVMNVHYGDILVKYGDVLDVETDNLTYLLDSTLVEKYQASLLQNGDIIIADAAEDETVGKCTEIAGLTTEIVLSGLHTIPCRSTIKFAEGYLGYYMNSRAYHDQLLPLIQGTKISSISKSAIQDTKVMYPKLEGEQAKIGSYFRSLDNLITLHQRKCEETKKLKKYMLQKMFPKDGESVPEIRFSGFTNAWEQRKLNEIAKKVTEKNKDNLYDEPLTNSAEQGIISQKDYFDREVVNEENLDGYYVVQDNDFVYNPRVSVTAPVGPINRNKLGRNGVMSPLYTVFRTHDIDTCYLEYYFKTTSWHRFMKLNGDSGARFDRFSIASSLFMEMPIPYPCMDEQERIGEYFQYLDNLITLHQRKCEELQNMKKFMLQNMFA